MKMDVFDFVCETFVEIMNLDKNTLRDGEKVFCEEHQKIYTWNALDGVWVSDKKEIPDVNPPKTFEEQMDEYFSSKGICLLEGGIALIRKDGTPAFSLFLNEKEESEMIFYNKQGDAVGVLNQSIFE